ncbi:DUF5787 family protein [Halovivax limisalsi]|uniref:DUF5787 family protein n=1 Tax=Halovivax limisalsi TaxID=1453760 RepID=UPI001FFD7835|nr:DUF5787 family protein [Halovivax limisalsi]
MSEFAFELELCAALEARGDGIVARQLGASVANPGGRVVDVVVVDPTAAIDRRAALTPSGIPDAILGAEVGPGRWTPVRDAFDCHPDRAQRAVERGVDIGVLERERRDGRDCIRQVARYPDWVDRIVGIENKPDLGRPGDLEAQLRTDVSLALVDEVILATESHVTGAHRNRLPDAVGIWRVHRRTGDAGRPRLPEIEVIRDPDALPVEARGVEPLSFEPGRTDISIVSPAEKADARRRLAERAYGKGWRTFGFPGCGACSARDPGRDGDGHEDGLPSLPHCQYEDRLVDAASECGPSCPGFDPASEPAVDLAGERDARTPWNADPERTRRRQSGLDRFG